MSEFVQFTYRCVYCILYTECPALSGFASYDCRMRWDQTEVTNIVSWGVPNNGVGIVVIIVILMIMVR